MIASDMESLRSEHVRKLFPEAVVVEDAERENDDKFRKEHKELRFVVEERSVVEEAVAVAVREEVDRIEQHDELERLIEAVGIIHDARQPEDARHDGNNQAFEVLAERGHRRCGPGKREEKDKHQRTVEEELQIVPARTYGENDVDVHDNHEHQVNVQSGDTGVGEDSGDRELDLSDELTVIAQGLGSLYDAVLNKKPRYDADEHECEEVDGKGVVTAEIDLHHLHGLDADREREPINEHRKGRLDDRPAGTDDGALIGLDQLVFGEQKNLLSEPFVFLENIRNQKTTSLQRFRFREERTGVFAVPHFSYSHYITFPPFVNQSYCQETGNCVNKIVNFG